MLIHCHVPKTFMETILVPIVKDKRESVTDENNYRPIALTSIFSKLFESIILNKYKDLLETSKHQFGFKNKHGTDMAAFLLKSVIDVYMSNSSPVYCIYDILIRQRRLTASISVGLFTKLLHRKIPIIIIRVLFFGIHIHFFM
jgi:hypothetical protein